MKVELLYFNGCPHYAPALDRLRTVLASEGVPAQVTEIEVKDEEDARRLGFPGSPTIRVDGADIEPGVRPEGGTGFACRRYPEGMPSEEMIRAALRQAGGR